MMHLITLSLHWLVCLALGLAFLLQLAVYRAPDLPDTAATRTSRRLMIGALLVGCIYLGYSGATGSLEDKPIVLVLGLVALAQMNSAKSRLFPEDDPAPPGEPDSKRGEL
jgi:hypothetical protein